MRGRSINIRIFMVLAVLTGVLNAAEDKEQVQRQVENQKEQLERVEEYILRRRGEIENYYAVTFAGLQAKADRELELLEVADKGVYSSLAAQAELAATVLAIHNRRLRAKDCFSSAGNTVGRADAYEHRDPWVSRDDIRISPKRFAAEQARIAEAKSEVNRKFKMAAVRLKRRREYAMGAGLEEVERQLKEAATAPKPEATHGVVGGIVYSKDKPLAIIDGKIVREGDSIHGVKVARIYRSRVEFEVGDKSWGQAVQQEAGAFWR